MLKAANHNSTNCIKGRVNYPAQISSQNFTAVCSGALLKHRSQDMQLSHLLLIFKSFEQMVFNAA